MEPHIFDRIEHFLLGKMDETETAAFTKALASDPELRKETENVSLLLLSTEANGLKRQLDGIHTELEKEGKLVPVRRFPVSAIAAVLLFLVAFPLVFILLRSSPEQRLYKALYTADAGLPSRMGAAGDPDFDEAMLLYKERKFEAAKEAFTRLAANNPSDTLHLYSGLCMIETGPAGGALDQLEMASKSSNRFIREKADWYLALAHLKNGRLEAAEKSFHAIQKKTTHRYLKDAGNALEMISDH